MDEGGLSLYMRLMQAFFGENAVNTKALGLLNNIAEVPKLRYHLMTNEVITLLMCVTVFKPVNFTRIQLLYSFLQDNVKQCPH